MIELNIHDIRNALQAGSRDGYELFKEIRDPDAIAKVKSHSEIGKLRNKIRQDAISVKDQAPQELTFKTFVQFLEDGNRSNYEALYKRSRKDLHHLILTEILENNGEYITAIEERLWQWCNLYTWELPAHVPLSPEEIKKMNMEADEVVALFSAETGFYFAEILSIIGDKLHPLLVYRLKKEIHKRIINAYKKRSFFWEGVAMNWASVCAGAVGSAALYSEEDMNELSLIIHRVIGSLNSYLSGFDKDGMTTEGLAYWGYGFSFYVYFAELLKERTNGRLDLMHQSDMVRKIAEVPLYLQFPDAKMINFSDAHGDEWHGEYGLLSRLSTIFKINEYKLPDPMNVYSDHTGSCWAISSRNLFWGLDAYDSKKDSPRTGCFYFQESQWIIDRRLNVQGQFYAFAAKGGHNDEPHNHNDLGHFILHFGGESLLCDLGSAQYVKQYFSDQRYTFLHASSRGHSVPIINGHEQEAGIGQYTTVDDFIDGKEITYALDVTAAYSLNELENFSRRFTWDYSGYELTINDSFRFSSEDNTIDEVFITYCPVERVKENELLIRGDTSSVLLNFDKNTTYEIVEEKVTNHIGKSEVVNRIVIKYNAGLGKCNIQTKFKLLQG